MKTCITVLLLFVVGIITGFSQKTHLYYLTADSTESNIIYIRLENQFRIQDNDNVQVIEPTRIAFIKDNILTVRPGKEGDLKVLLKTKNGLEDFTFHAQHIRDYLFSITPSYSKLVSKKDVIDYSKVIISGKKEIKKSIDFYKNYNIIFCDVVINNKVYAIDGNAFSPEIIKEIEDATSNSTIIIQHISAYNATTHATIKDEKDCSFLVQ